MTAWQKRIALVLAMFAGSAALAQEQATEVDVQIREAEARLEEAARQIAELSAAQIARVENIERRIRVDGRPVMGINVGGDETGPVEGVRIVGVTPGGAADEAGLRAGDYITAVNGESMSAGSGREATTALLDFMKGVEEGDVLDVEYLRNGKASVVEVTPAPSSAYRFSFRFGGDEYNVPVSPIAPGAFAEKFVWFSGDDGWGDMELVELNEGLGRYFGTDSGLLVVKAPENEQFKLEDGDVIRSIDGRTPTSVSHALRILGSYQSGETLKIEIMRDKRTRTLDVEVPDNRQSATYVVPEAPEAPVIHREVIRETREST